MRGLATHEQGDADDALVADHGDFGRCAVFHDVEQRHDGGGGEIDVAHRNTGFANGVAQRHRDQFQMGEQARIFVRREGGEQVILAGVMGVGHE